MARSRLRIPGGRRKPNNKFETRVKEFPGSHPINSVRAHNKLLDYCLDRLDHMNQIRPDLTERFADIDRQYSGYLEKDFFESKREQDTKKGRGVKPTLVSLPLTKGQIREAVAYMMRVFAPDLEMFEGAAPADKQNFVNGLARAMNKHAKLRQYFRNYMLFLTNSMKYNLGPMEVEWTSDYGVNLVANSANVFAQTETDSELWTGNKVTALDPYNFMWDLAVVPADLPLYGEWYANVEMLSEHQIQRKVDQGEIVAKERFVKEGPQEFVYYFEKPIIRADTDARPITNWASILTENRQGDVGRGYEVVAMTIWLNPKDFGLSKDDQMQIWRIRIANAKWIVGAEQIKSAHNMLPVVCAMPVEDTMGMDQQTLAEEQLPLQTFGSHLMNTSILSSRKSLYGITIYDPSRVDFTQVPDGDVAGRVPVLPAGYGENIREMATRFEERPNTNETMPDLAQVIDLMQKQLPTNVRKQVADLQRATRYQAAATVQGGHELTYLFARLVDDQAMTPMRIMQAWNIMQFGSDQIVVVDKEGKESTAVTEGIRASDIEQFLGEGLQSIDKLALIEFYKDLVNSVIQSQVALQEVDFMALLNYMSSLMGDKTDIRRFRRQMQPVTADQLGAANEQLAAGAEGNVRPGTGQQPT